MLATVVLASLLPLLAAALPCIQFDTQWNLYAFGGSQDVRIGQSSTWAQPAVQPLTSTGRPPWTGNATQCLLSQFNNAMYVTGADASDFSKVYIYSFNTNTWSTQSTTSAPSAPLTRSSSILDHDTNVIFTFTNGGLTQLDMSSVTGAATSSALAWEGVSAPSWGSGYSGLATAAQASNHILYFGVPNTAVGSAQVFTIHYAYFQPQAQAFPVSGGTSFPTVGGQAVSIPQNGDGAPNQVIFIPSDYANTYVINHWTNPSSYASTDGSPYAANLINTTSILPPPTLRQDNAAYAASYNALVQVSSSGDIYYINNAVSGGSAVAGASWTKMNYAVTGGSAGSSSSSSASSASASGTATSSSASGSASRSGTASTSPAASGSGAAAVATSSRAAAGQVAQLGFGVGAMGGLVVVALVAGAAGVSALL